MNAKPYQRTPEMQQLLAIAQVEIDAAHRALSAATEQELATLDQESKSYAKTSEAVGS
jgi:hypothetical protein